MPPIPDVRSNYLFDTVALSNFALAGQVELLVSRYGRRLRVTEEVLDEITDGVVAGYLPLRAIEEAVADGRFSRVELPARGETRAMYRRLLRVLAPGEASCLAYARAHRGIVVTDDRTARAYCAESGVTLTGTVGVLKACCLAGALSADEADTILHTMIREGYYSPVQRISDLL